MRFFAKASYFKKKLHKGEVNNEGLLIARCGLLENEVDDVVVDRENGVVKHVIEQVETFVGYSK